MNDSQRKAMFAKGRTIDTVTVKELVKAIDGKGRDEHTEPLYSEIERRNKDIPHPKRVKVGTVFRDDPDAINKQQQKVNNFQNEVDYWKKITKFPHRDWQNHNQLGDSRWWALSNASTNLREAKKKLTKLEEDKKNGVVLERGDTFKSGKKRFFYKEIEKEDT